MKAFLVSLLSVVFTAALMAQAIPPASSAAPSLVTVTGYGKLYAEPDEVHFSIDISTEGESLLAAKTENAQLAAKAIAYLKEKGVEERYIQTAYLNVNVQYRDRQRMDPRYYASQTIKVCLKKLDDYEPISYGLLERGITGLRGPQFQSTRSDELRAEARVAAIKDARERATKLAEALGQTIGKAYSIVSAQASHSPQTVYARSAEMSMDAGSQGPGFAAGELLIQESVTASFHLR